MVDCWVASTAVWMVVKMVGMMAVQLVDWTVVLKAENWDELWVDARVAKKAAAKVELRVAHLVVVMAVHLVDVMVESMDVKSVV